MLRWRRAAIPPDLQPQPFVLDFELGELVLANELENLFDVSRSINLRCEGSSSVSPELRLSRTLPDFRQRRCHVVRTSTPSSVTSTSSSIRTPPQPGK